MRKNAPQTREGAAAWRAAIRAPAFQMLAVAGLGGGSVTVTGLDWASVLAFAMAHEDGLDPRRLRDCLGAIETGRLEAQSQTREADT